jgi:hypothetical protein
VTDQPPRSTNPGWFPDPTGRYEFRYFNGSVWTGDVSTAGMRFVDPLSNRTPASFAAAGRTRNGIATAALTCGILSAALGWLPVVFVVGFVLAVLGIVFGAIGLGRARVSGVGRGFAITGLVTGGLGVASSIAGAALTVVTFRAVERYLEPAAHTVEIDRCEVIDERATVAGTIRNDGDRRADFTVVVAVLRDGTSITIGSARRVVDDVAPGATGTFEISEPVSVGSVDCEIADVTGPLPFGIVPD